VNNEFEVIGTLVFDPPHETKKHEKQGEWKKTAFINLGGEIHVYYQWLLNKRFNLKLNKPLRVPHVTFINDRIPDTEFYNKVKTQFENKEVSVFYKPDEIRSAINTKSFYIKDQEVKGRMQHWWLRARCPQVEPIRTLLGLEAEPYNRFHISIGYVNEYENKDLIIGQNQLPVANINFLHSEYILRQILKFNL
jgi:hypothetical protein